MDIYYLSDGEHSARMSMGDLTNNLQNSYGSASRAEMLTETAFGSVVELVTDMLGALDAQGFWHGTLSNYNVAVITVSKIQRLDADYAIKHPYRRTEA